MMEPQKISERLRIISHAAPINRWVKFIEDTFPDLETAAAAGLDSVFKEHTSEKLSIEQEFDIASSIYSQHGLTISFSRVAEYVDGVTISWEEK